MRCKTPIWVEPNDEAIQVPCGKCLYCLINKRMDWSIRLYHEHRHSKGSCFVTLTYNDRFKPKDGQLAKSDFQKYMKRLRKKCNQKLRYYAVGEYGTKRKRPHYHILLFNIQPEEYNKVKEAWTLDGKEMGIVHIGQVNEASIQYCLKYVVQPEQKGNEIPPFATMSRSYGIGGMYLQDAVIDWHRNTESAFSSLHGQKTRLPRFYKEKIWSKPEERASISNKQKVQAEIAEELENQKLEKMGYNPREIKKQMSGAFLKRVKTKVAFTETL